MIYIRSASFRPSSAERWMGMSDFRPKLSLIFCDLMELLTASYVGRASQCQLLVALSWAWGIVRKPEQYQESALQCLRLAERATEPGSKAFLLEMAQAWIRLADHYKDVDN